MVANKNIPNIISIDNNIFKKVLKKKNRKMHLNILTPQLGWQIPLSALYTQLKQGLKRIQCLLPLR